MDKQIILVPAYGRDYRTAEEVLAAWRAGKDFLISDVSCPHDGRYISLSDVEHYGMEDWTFRIRFFRLTCIVFVAMADGEWKIVGRSDESDEGEGVE